MDSVTDDRVLVCRVSPFGNLRIDAYVPLPEAYRSLSRPSSAPDAKAFPLCSFSLNLASMQAPYRALRCISFSSRIFIRSDGDEGARACRDIGSLNYAGSFQDFFEIVLPCVAASSVSFAPPFTAELALSAAPPFPRESSFARMRRGERRSLRSLSTIASEFPSVALLVFPLFSFQCAVVDASFAHSVSAGSLRLPLKTSYRFAASPLPRELPFARMRRGTRGFRVFRPFRIQTNEVFEF